MEIHVVIPKGAETDIELGLVTLTAAIAAKTGGSGGYGLGGENGYGENYETDIFAMHRYCWCDRDDCGWCNGEDLPNFTFKPTGAKIWWYKWIGRSQKQEGMLPADWLKRCMASLEGK